MDLAIGSGRHPDDAVFGVALVYPNFQGIRVTLEEYHFSFIDT